MCVCVCAKIISKKNYQYISNHTTSHNTKKSQDAHSHTYREKITVSEIRNRTHTHNEIIGKKYGNNIKEEFTKS